MNPPSIPSTKLPEPPYTAENLEEISNLLQQQDSQWDVVKSLFNFPILQPLLAACSIQRSLGRKLLVLMAKTDPTLLKHFVKHKLLIDINPSIRLTCLQCVFDLIEETAQPKEEKNNRICFSELENHISEELILHTPLESKSLESIIQKSVHVIDEKTTSPVANAIELPEQPHLDLIIDDKKEFDVLPSSGSSSDLSEDDVPDLIKSKGSLSWFITGGSISGAESKTNLFNFTVTDETEESEELNALSPSEKRRQEEAWFKSCKVPSTFTSEGPRRSILKCGTPVSTEKTTPRIPDTPDTSFMHKLIGFGVVVVLGDLASLDPVTECRLLAKKTLELLLDRSPDSLMQRLPKNFGHFVGSFRELVPRKASRPINLDKSTWVQLQRLYGDLEGRTLVVGEGGADFAEKLMSYFDSLCGQNAQELIVGVYHNEINQLRRYPGFSDMHHKLYHRSRVQFEEIGDCKLFDPVDTSDALSDQLKTKSTVPINIKSEFMFNVDATKLDEDERFKDKKFNNVIWNFPQVEHDVADLRLKYENRDLVSNFLKSVTSLLQPKATVRLAFHTNVYKDPDTGEEVSDNQFDTWGLAEVLKRNFFHIKAAKNLPKKFYKATNVFGKEFPFSKATLYILGHGDEEPSFMDSDDTYNSEDES